LDTAYRSFGGEVEASSTPTICRLSDSRRHQISAIAPVRPIASLYHAVATYWPPVIPQTDQRPRRTRQWMEIVESRIPIEGYSQLV